MEVNEAVVIQRMAVIVVGTTDVDITWEYHRGGESQAGIGRIPHDG